MSRPLLSASRQQLALQSYLDDLLQEATLEVATAELRVLAEPVVAVPEPAPASAPTIAMDEFEAAVREELARDAERQVAIAAAPVALAPPMVPVEPPPVVAPAPVIDTPAPQAAPAQVVEPPAAPEVGPPDWAEAPFECLLFDVAGLTLAVPLVSLGSIYPLEADALTPLFGQPDWFLGLLPCQAGNLKVLDTARWLMPERYCDDFRQGLSYVISVQGYDWGLAVHQVSRSIRLHPDEVKWRSQRTQRPWLAGTVIEHMCALLDVAALAELIASGALRQGGGQSARR